jgi:hypothetical protein
VGLGANDIRTVKKLLVIGLGESCNFGDTINPVKQGAAKLEVAGSLPVFDNSDGTIIWEYQYKPVLTSNDSRMYSWATVDDGSFGTFHVASPGHVVCHHQWVNGVEYTDAADHGHAILNLSGQTAVSALPTTTISFGLEFAEMPTVFVCGSAGSTNPSPGRAQVNQQYFVKEVTTKDFQVKQSTGYLPQGGSGSTIMWWACGHYARGL